MDTGQPYDKQENHIDIKQKKMKNKILIFLVLLTSILIQNDLIVKAQGQWEVYHEHPNELHWDLEFAEDFAFDRFNNICRWKLCSNDMGE